MRCLPERGRIGIFNRSYYEEVLAVRVHPELLKNERIPAPLITKSIWEDRFQDICALERYLPRNGIVVRKFFLNVSPKEQKRRFLERLEEPEKNWKFSAADVREREYWDDYMDSYEDMIRRTASQHAPWFVVPADHKWFTRLAQRAGVNPSVETIIDWRTCCCSFVNPSIETICLWHICHSWSRLDDFSSGDEVWSRGRRLSPLSSIPVED